MKPLIYPLCCVLITAVPFSAIAQTPPGAAAAQDAVRESLLRDAARLELRQKLADAQVAQRKGDLYLAMRLYDEAADLARLAQTGVEQEYRQVITGMTQVRLALAEQAQRRGEFEQADLHANKILREDPKNEAALAFKAQNAQLRESFRGRMPSQETISKIPEIINDRARAATLVQDGKLLFEMGKLDDSEVKLNQAIKIDPSNNSAYTYLNLIREQRHKNEVAKREEGSKNMLLQVDNAWNDPVKRALLPSPNIYVRTNIVYTGTGRQALYSKLERIRLD